MPHTVQSEPDKTHPFETDLDIVCERSLHRLLDCSVTSEGSLRLKSWLVNTAPDARVIKRRQSLVKELKESSLFRDKLSLYSASAGGEAKGKWNSNVLIDWHAHDARNGSLLSTVWTLGILAALNISLLMLSGFGLIPHVWPIGFLIYVTLMIARQGQVAAAWGELLELEMTLRRFRVVFRYLESRVHTNGPGLTKLCSPFADKANRPSAHLRRAERMAAASVCEPILFCGFSLMPSFRGTFILPTGSSR